MTDVHLYNSPPLIEVIVELRWALIPLQAVPGAVDPGYQDLCRNFERGAASNGYSVQERLVPQEIPPELASHQPHIRFRQAVGQWPCLQIGPGIMTVNVTPRAASPGIPSYDGWVNFRKTVRLAINLLYESYPNASRQLHLERKDLRYLDAFTKEHGFKSSTQFVSNELGFRAELPPAIVSDHVEDLDAAKLRLEWQFQAKAPPQSRGVIRIATGRSNKLPALILDTSLSSRQTPAVSGPDEILAWLDAAHTTIHAWFETIVSGKVKALMDKDKQA